MQEEKTSFIIKVCDKALYQKSVINLSTKRFNNLLASVGAVNKFKGFKEEVKSMLLNNTFYSLDEFLHSEFA
jgi:hypothetical protein